jgi:hypothetical protein
MKKLLILTDKRAFNYQPRPFSADHYTLLKPDRVFDGQEMHPGWWVLVKGKRIERWRGFIL